MSELGEAWAASLKSIKDCQESAQYCRQVLPRLCGHKSIATSSKDRQIGALLIGLTIKLGCSIKRKKKTTKSTLLKIWLANYSN